MSHRLPPRLASAIAHSLANSLTVIRGALEVGAHDPEELLQHVDAAAAVGSAIATGWGLGDDPAVPVDVRRVAMMAALTMSSELSGRATLTLEQGPDLPAVVAPQGRVLRACLGMLLALSDAIEGTDKPVHIELRTHGDMTTVVIDALVVHDGTLDVDEVTASPWLGEADTIVQTLRGRFRARNDGEELRLSIRLAVDNGLAPQTIDTDQARPRALVVDDQGFVLKVLSTLLVALGWEAVAVGSVDRALEVLEDDEDFQLVLSDLVMPGRGGDAFFEILHERWPELARRFVVCTGGATTMARARFLNGVQVPVLRKPVSLADLRRVLGAAEGSP